MRNSRFRYVIIAIMTWMLATLVCCERHTSAWQTMDRAERLMLTFPDSSLLIRDSVDAVALGGKEEKARYANYWRLYR